MSVNRNDKGQLQKGSTLNPTGRPRNAYARLLAEMKQVEFVEFYYGLFDKTPAELQAMTTSLEATNMQRVAARLMFDCIKGGNPNYLKIFLALLGINVSGTTNILVNDAAFKNGEDAEIKDVGPNLTHKMIVELVEKIQEKKKKEKE